MQRKTIVVYSEFPAEVSCLRLSLNETFNGSAMAIYYAKDRDFYDGGAFGDPTAVIVLPGAANGDGYRRMLGRSGEAIRAHVAGGGGLLAICAATYPSFTTYSFLTEAGILKEFTSSAALVRGHVHGPLPELSDPAKRWGGMWANHAVARLEFHDDTGARRDAGICYSKGGRMTIDPGERCDVIATFRDVAGQPPAIAGKAIGRGYAVFSSVGIEINARKMYDLIVPADDHTRQGRRYLGELVKAEQSRDQLWAMIWRKLIHHAQAPAPV